MNKRSVLIITSLVVLASIILGIIAYPQLPEMAASHWDELGNPNSYMSRFWSVALIPLMIIGLTALLLFLPNIDPLKKNIIRFQLEYNKFIVVIGFFLLYVHALSIFWNLGYKFNLSSMILPGMGLFIFFVGTVIEKAKRNFFIGIRTPWTLSSDTVWDKTHQLGGKLFKISGVLTLGGFIFPNQSAIFLLVPLLGSSLSLTVYSYFLFRKENPAGQQ